MNSNEEIEIARCMKKSLDTGTIIESQKQNVTMNDESISMIDTIHDLEQENKQLKEQLAEKDKEIEKLYKILDSQKIIKQVCDEIREYIAKEYGTTVEDISKIYHRLAWTVKEIYELLDKIEQGKENLNEESDIT